MKRLFRSFETAGLEYLLTSGQASVLYGAAAFSEDVDIWIRPTPLNAQRLLRALARCHATVYKLTPPLTSRWMRAGHGFHFLAPDRPQEVFLDVMACPPRVVSFENARRRAIRLSSDWGQVPVVSIPDLVLLKRTRRLNDYEVISNLVQIAVRTEERPSLRLLKWAAAATCRAEDRVRFLRDLGQTADVETCRRSIAKSVSQWQSADVRYWRPRLHELRRGRTAERLLPVGTPVKRLLT